MDTKLIYAAAATALDSWDIDNLRYIRRISRGQPPENINNVSAPPPPAPADISYLSECAEEAGEDQQDAEESTTESRQQQRSDSMIPIPSMGVLDNSILRTSDEIPSYCHTSSDTLLTGSAVTGTLYEKLGSSSQDSDDLPFLPAQPPRPIPGGTARSVHEDCYLLDVVTIQNESVLAFSSHSYPMLAPPGTGQPGKQQKAKNSIESSSAPGSSCSSASSTTEEAAPVEDLLMITKPGTSSNQERDYFDLALDNHERRDVYHHKRTPPPASKRDGGKLISNKKKNSMATRESDSDPCPYCDHSSNNNNNTVYVVKQQHPENTSANGRHHQQDPEPESPRSPSPYYVRLRRDLLAMTITPQPHNGIGSRRPRNFSVTPQGQLAIDYSSNWLGLEQYMNNLKR